MLRRIFQAELWASNFTGKGILNKIELSAENLMGVHFMLDVISMRERLYFIESEPELLAIFEKQKEIITYTKLLEIIT